MQLSPEQEVNLRSLSKTQRKNLYDLLTIFHLTFYDKDKREIIEELRELIRKNTYEKRNECEFDKTLADKARETFEKRMQSFHPKRES